jgi:hypothetical protein
MRGTLNQRGVEFAPYRLLIASIMGLLILVIILSAIRYFESVEISVSIRQLVSGFDAALENLSDASDPKIIEKELRFPRMSIAAKYFEDRAHGMHSEKVCVELQAARKEGLQLSGGGRALDITKKLHIRVFFTCVRSSGECTVNCYIAFGKRPEV